MRGSRLAKWLKEVHRQTEIKELKGRDKDKCSSRKGKQVSVNQRIGCIWKSFEELRRDRGRERERRRKNYKERLRMKKSEDKKKSISRRGNCCVGVFFPPVPSRPKIGWLRLNFDNLLFLVSAKRKVQQGHRSYFYIRPK